MSHTAQIPSHRKPARNTSRMAVRAGVAGGVLGALAVAGASGAANAAEPVTQTLELPTLTADLAAQVAQSADATQQAAASYELSAERDAAAATAAKQAKANLAQAKAKAEAARKAEAERKKAAASRSSERTTLASSASTATTSTTSTSTSTSTSSSTASGSAAAVIAFAKAQIGDAYVLGATGPNSWDCSSLLQAAFKQAGISLPRVSQDQSTAGTPVSLSNLQPGDILYWGSAGSGAYHVALYVGGGNFVGAENPSTGIVERPLSWDPPTGAVRVL
ncbi:C40 family peptidase [Streptomyces sp. NBC_00285]|uniref:C40 family peptidase n=1 Tax=Streptomyces sp. NBC_00285 TaxID=2975700 RepID=UPI002E2A209E|nr:C40 family peptidase [Streptomyces sp. NBC_00285]